VSKDSGLPAFHELLLAGFCKSRGSGICPVASAPDFVFILGNDAVICNLVPGLDHVDVVSVGNDA
jgi:hypothetical protein